MNIPQSDMAKVMSLSRDFGWIVVDLGKPEENAISEDTEQIARKIAFSEEDFERMKTHGFYASQRPDSPVYASVEEEVAALDSIDNEGYVTHEELSHLRNLWKNLP